LLLPEAFLSSKCTK